MYFLYNREQGIDEYMSLDGIIDAVAVMLKDYTADQFTVISGDDVTDRVIKLAAAEHK